MKTQISRASDRPGRRYSGVYQQQGRMITDADWNELVEILKRRLDGALATSSAAAAARPRAGACRSRRPAADLARRGLCRRHPARVPGDPARRWR